MKGVEISSDQPFIFLKLYWLFSFRITFFNGPVAAIHSVIGYIEQIIFDSSYLLKTATYLEEHLRHSIFLRTVDLFHDSNGNHPSLEVVDLFLSQKECQSSIFWRALYFVDRRTCNSYLFPKNVGSNYATFQRYYNYLHRIYSEPSTVSTVLYIVFTDVKICSHSVLSTPLLSAYFRTPVTGKQFSYQSSCIFRAASIISK